METFSYNMLVIVSLPFPWLGNGTVALDGEGPGTGNNFKRMNCLLRKSSSFREYSTNIKERERDTQAAQSAKKPISELRIYSDVCAAAHVCDGERMNEAEADR